jgi:hypothetical protein
MVAVPAQNKETNMNIKTLVAVAVAVTGALGAGLAQAHPDVRWSVAIGLPLPVIVERAPVYAQPAPVYVQPAPAYYGRPGYVYAPRYATRWDVDGDGIPNRYDRHDGRWDPRGDHHGRDRDHDGYRNRDDRYPDRPARH